MKTARSEKRDKTLPLLFLFFCFSFHLTLRHLSCVMLREPTGSTGSPSNCKTAKKKRTRRKPSEILRNSRKCNRDEGVGGGCGSLHFPTNFCFLKNLSEVRMLTTFYHTKNDHRWVTFTIVSQLNLPPRPKRGKGVRGTPPTSVSVLG